MVRDFEGLESPFRELFAERESGVVASIQEIDGTVVILVPDCSP